MDIKEEMLTGVWEKVIPGFHVDLVDRSSVYKFNTDASDFTGFSLDLESHGTPSIHSATPATVTENASHLEYILIGVFGSIILIFFICQAAIYAKHFKAKRNTWGSRRRWWTMFKWRRRRRFKRTRADCPVAKTIDSVWTSNYDTYEAVQCRFGQQPTSPQNEAASHEPSTPKSEVEREGDSPPQGVYVVDPVECYTLSISNSPELNLESGLSDPLPSPVLPYGEQCLVSTAIQCENPGYETDSSSNAKTVISMSMPLSSDSYTLSSDTSSSGSSVRVRVDTVSAKVVFNPDSTVKVGGSGIEREPLPGLSPMPPQHRSSSILFDREQRRMYGEDSSLTSVSSCVSVIGVAKTKERSLVVPKPRRNKLKVLRQSHDL